MPFEVGETVHFAGGESIVEQRNERDGRAGYLITNGSERLPMWIPEDILEAHQQREHPLNQFEPQTPALVVVDDFFNDPYEVREVAFAQDYTADASSFSGLRSTKRYLWPYLREEFGRLLGSQVSEWFAYKANGVFQQTTAGDPLVWHCDEQKYAGAVYLTPEAPPGSGMSFWRDRTYGCRRDPIRVREQRRLGGPKEARAARGEVFGEFNIEHPDNWELVESVAGLFNRLVLWEASLIHSATSHDESSGESEEAIRLVQLFFFDTA